MDRETYEKLKERWPEKPGRSVDPSQTRIDKVLLATEGHEYVPCKTCGGKGAVPVEGKRGEVEPCGVCKGEGRLPTFDTLQELTFDVERAWIAQGNRLIVVCESDKRGAIDRARIRKHVD